MNFQCRICLEEDELDKLMSPCKCSGTSKYVHKYCLNKWIIISKKHEKCNVCNADYARACLYNFSELIKQNVFENLEYFHRVDEIRIQMEMERRQKIVLQIFILTIIFIVCLGYFYFPDGMATWYVKNPWYVENTINDNYKILL
jgi:E3 ubiquitin-protein ligase DOA10